MPSTRTFRLLLAVLLAATAASAQDYPSSMPKACDPDTCNGCTPFQPPKKIPSVNYDPLDNRPCGYDGEYFPVPLSIVRNNTSPEQELLVQQYLCVACCSASCGYNFPGSYCAIDNYDWKETGKTKYGCTSCAGTLVELEDGGDIKTYFEDFTSAAVYKMVSMPYGTCGLPPPPLPKSPPPFPSPPQDISTPPSPTLVPSPSPSLSPETSPPPVSDTPPSPGSSPTPSSGPAPAPSDGTSPSPAIIVTTFTPPPPSAATGATFGGLAFAAAALAAALLQ